MNWSFGNDRPIYLQVMEQLKLGIISGELPAGSRLPAVREMAAEAAINPNTMQKALSELEREGLLYAQRTNGRFVTEDSELLRQLRYRLARDKLVTLISQMQRLGYPREELATMIQKIFEEDSENGTDNTSTGA
ncbi:MAG: GntR family transcriptional regulator [Angelakisella sp.]